MFFTLIPVSYTHLVPTFAKPVRIPGAVSLSIDAEGEASNFYADDGVYYVINNNSGYTGDLEIALVPLEFATDILGEKLDEKGVLTETNTAEVSQFALLFEFSGDKNKIRHCLFCCSASRPATESSTVEDLSLIHIYRLPLYLMWRRIWCECVLPFPSE